VRKQNSRQTLVGLDETPLTPDSGFDRKRARGRRKGREAASALLLAVSVVIETLRGQRWRGSRGRTPIDPARRAQVRVITPRRQGAVERAREFWEYRRLLAFFARRFTEKMYIRTWLGRVWIPLRPVLSVGARVLIFGGLLSVPSEGKPYLIFFLVGVASWELFAQTAYWATRSIELSRGVLARIYVPRLTALVAAVVPSAINFLVYVAITFVAVLGYLVVDGVLYVELGAATLLAGAGLALMVLLALGIGLWTSIYGAQARDVRFSLAYVLQFWFFLTPVIYPLSAIPERYRSVVALNPMTAPVEMVKEGVLGAGTVTPLAIAITVSTVTLLVISGLWFFGRAEGLAVDRL
jgi:lipopolysaccharide transport system permease protein